MKWQMFPVALMLEFMLLTTGCKSLFPQNESISESRWQSWSDVNAAFGKIIPHKTTVNDLRTLGFDPDISPNIKILTAVEIIPMFRPCLDIRMQELPEGVQEYFLAKTNTCAYLIDLQNTRDKRQGNLFLDALGFKRVTHQSGWNFRGLILIKGNLVVYKLFSGEPQLSREDKQVKPLGPFQEIDDTVVHSIGFVK